MAALIVCASLAITMVVLTWFVFLVDAKVIGEGHGPDSTENAREL